MKKIIVAAILFISTLHAKAQEKQITRIAIITVDSLKTDAYRELLKEQMGTAVKTEPGVISYTVYADKNNPAKLTIIEVYADNNAYLQHRETVHFKKYKAATKDMVTSLELSEVTLVLSAKK